jgi:iron complex outermembrane receptor protein
VAGTSYDDNAVPGLAPNRVDGVLEMERGMGFAELRALWQDDVPVDDAGTESASSYTLVDVVVGLRSLALRGFDLEPFVGVSNVFDEAYVASVVPNAFGSRYFEPGPPRTFRAGLGVTWGPGR